MQISDNEIYLLIKYIKSVLWRVAKRLSYKEDARCLKVKCTHKIHRHPLPPSNGGRDEGSGDPNPLKYDTHNKPLLEIYTFCMNHIFIEYTVTQHHHPLLTVVTIFGFIQATIRPCIT